MRVLSFVYGEHCCGLAVVENGRPKYCYEEERFTRVKTSTDWRNLNFRFPVASLYELKYKNGEDINNFDLYYHIKRLIHNYHYTNLILEMMLMRNLYMV